MYRSAYNQKFRAGAKLLLNTRLRTQRLSQLRREKERKSDLEEIEREEWVKEHQWVGETKILVREIERERECLCKWEKSNWSSNLLLISKF